MRFLVICLVTFVAASASVSLQRALHWPDWSTYAICAAAAVTGYIISALLIGYYVQKRSGLDEPLADIAPGVQAWELTAGTGVIPRWVSMIGVLAIGFAIAIPFQIVAQMLR